MIGARGQRTQSTINAEMIQIFTIARSADRHALGADRIP
jgi:hypothetical protein